MTETVNLEVLNPVAEKDFTFFEAAPKLTDLKGKKIGLHWNSKAGGDVALEEVSRLLKSRYQDIEFANFVWPSFAPLTREFVEQLLQSKCDAFVGSTGD